MMRPRTIALTGRHVLAACLGFFGLVAAVNAAMIWIALDSWPGLSGAGYRDAAAQRAMMAQNAARAALGWRAHRSLRGTGLARAITVQIRDAGGEPVPGLSLTAEFRRPVRQSLDRRMALSRLGDFRHVGEIELPAAGKWTLYLAAHRDGKEIWAEESVIWLK